MTYSWRFLLLGKTEPSLLFEISPPKRKLKGWFWGRTSGWGKTERKIHCIEGQPVIHPKVSRVTLCGFLVGGGSTVTPVSLAKEGLVCKRCLAGALNRDIFLGRNEEGFVVFNEDSDSVPFEEAAEMEELERDDPLGPIEIIFDDL